MFMSGVIAIVAAIKGLDFSLFIGYVGLGSGLILAEVFERYEIG